MERWIGKTAVVTGASSGIGAALVIDLVNAGIKVVALARRMDRLEQLKNQMSFDAGGKFYPIKCDVTVEDEVKKVFAWIEETLGGTDILVNNAGVLRNINVIDKDNTDAVRQTIDTNIMGVVFCTREAFLSMKARNFDGHIVIINSITGHKVPYLVGVCPSFNIYPATKHAMTGLTESLRQEMYEQGTKVKITSISPGVTQTEIFTPAHVAAMSSETPSLECKDVSQAIIYCIATPPHVQVHELTIKPIGEIW